MKVFKAENTPFTGAIISDPTRFGQDRILMDFLRGMVTDENWEVEIASHGANHTDYSEYTIDEAVYQLTSSVNNIKKQLGVPYVKTFVPPFNAFNNVTIPALIKANFTHWSAQIQTDRDTKPGVLSGQTFYGFPIGAATNQLNEDERFIGDDAEKTFAFLEGQLQVYGWGAVMMHPQEFTNGFGLTTDNTVNQTMIQELIKLVNLVKAKGYEIVPLGRLNHDSQGRLTGSLTGFPNPEMGHSSEFDKNYIIVAGVTAGLFGCLCIVFILAFVKQTLSYGRG
jgi:peptidoglycan/xylan/chitin deacetylase (PgdA/CDA1 family)